MRLYVKGIIKETFALGTLAGQALVSGTVSDTLGEVSTITSIVCRYSMRSYTPADDDGPILVGFAHADYSDAEIEEVIEIADSWNRANKIDLERSRRLVRQVGVFAPSANDPLAPQVLNDGKPIKTKLNWTMQSGQTLKFWAYNLGSSALATTVPDVFINGHANIFMKG